MKGKHLIGNLMSEREELPFNSYFTPSKFVNVYGLGKSVYCKSNVSFNLIYSFVSDIRENLEVCPKQTLFFKFYLKANFYTVKFFLLRTRSCFFVTLRRIEFFYK